MADFVKLAAGLVLAFGLVELAKFLIIAAGVGYVLYLLLPPYALILWAVFTAVAVAVGYGTVFAVWRLSKGSRLRVGEAVALSHAAIFDAMFSAVTFSPLLTISNLLLGVALYQYARSRVAEALTRDVA
ncbi:MAG: hypothetical protein QXI84_11220 [Thermofilaceae archaeon]